MAKIIRKWIDLLWTSSDCLRAQDIPYNIDHNIQSKISSIENTKIHNLIRNDNFDYWNANKSLPILFSVLNLGTGGSYSTSCETNDVNFGNNAFKLNINSVSSGNFVLRSDEYSDLKNWSLTSYTASAWVKSSSLNSIWISIDTYDGSTWTNNAFNSQRNATTSWEKISYTFNVPQTIKQIRFNITFIGTQINTYFVDSVCLTKGSSNLFIKNSNEYVGSKNTYIVADIKSSGYDGGSFSSGSWRTRTINSELTTVDWGYIYYNRIYLYPGIYKITASAPAYRTGYHMARFYSITGDSISITGTSEYSYTSSSSSQTRSNITGVFEITTLTGFELQHRCTNSRNNDGFGRNSDFDVDEKYTEIMIEKLG